MRMRWVVGLAAAVAVVVPAAAVRAEDGPRAPPWAFRFESGVVVPRGHMIESGFVHQPPPLYLGASFERAVVGPLRANVNGGISFLLGWLAGGTIRYAAYDTEAIALSCGVGPLVAWETQFGAAGVFAQADVVLQVRIAGSFGSFAGMGAGFALNQARSRQCGADTCRAYLERGDYFASFRGGVGWAF